MYRILVVDDQETTANYIRAVLKTRGMAAMVCGGAEAALEAFKAEPYDLVLTDLQMGNVDGLWLVRALRAMGAQVPVVVMTGFETLASAGESLRLGVFDYVTKPLEVEALVKTVTRALALSQATAGSVDLELVVPAHQVLGGMVAVSPVMRGVIDEMVHASNHDQPVLIVGEKGTGRSLVAGSIHAGSRRKQMPIYALSGEAICAHPPESLSELVKSAGTVFLEDVGEMSVEAQNALLAVLPARAQNPGEGGPQPRLMASAVSDLPALRQAGALTADLAARLAAGVTLSLPPLRERKEELLPLLLHFLRRAMGEGNELPRLEMRIFDMFENYGWPGNIRELEAAAASLAAGRKNGCAMAEALPAAIRETAAGAAPAGARHNLDSVFMKCDALRKFLRDAGLRELRSRVENASADRPNK